MSKTVTTKKGSVLPLLSLKGKDYLMVAHRLQWLSDEHENYTVETEFPLLTEEQTISRATITIFDKEGKVVRKATATKRETKKDFSDHTEKSETAAIGRALAIIGLGTQHAISDLDEGTRLADSPVVNTKELIIDDLRPVHRTTEAAVEKPAVSKPVANGAANGVTNGKTTFRPTTTNNGTFGTGW